MTLDSRVSSTRRHSTAVHRALVVFCLLDDRPCDRCGHDRDEHRDAREDRARAGARRRIPRAAETAARRHGSIVPENPLLVSVSPPSENDGAYGLAFEGRFLDQLSDDELRAVVAHELGHVWIFTHHPYLQTEAGANRIAERLVTRQTLERVYAKVWPEGAPRSVVARFAEAR